VAQDAHVNTDSYSKASGDGSDFDIGADEYIAPLPGVKDWDLY